MGECKLDHSAEDVRKKLEEQSAYLPPELYERMSQFLKRTQPQETLNQAFHLLKKYDLSTEEERAKRNERIRQMLTSENL